MQEIKQTKTTFDLMMIIHCVLLFLGICAGLWINGYLFVLVAVATIAVAVFGKIEYSFYHLLFCLPFTMIYKLSPESTSLFAYVMLAVGVILIIKMQTFSAAQLLPIMLFAIYALIGMGNNATTVIKMVMGLILFYIFVKKIEPSGFKNQIMAFTLGMMGSSLIGLLKGSWGRLDMYYADMNTMYIGTEETFRFSGLYLDPNYYSISVIFAITLCIMLFFNNEGNRILIGVMIGALAIFGFMSYSKMFLFAILLVVLIFILRGSQTPRQKLVTLLVFSLGIGLLYTWMINNSYISEMTERLFEDGDITTGRNYIWSVYLNYIFDSPLTLLFGDGIGAGNMYVGGAHNTFIESIYLIGIFGSIIFLVTFISIFLYKKYDIKRNIVNYALPIVFVFMISSLGCLTINDLMFYFMMIWIGFNFDLNIKAKIEQGDKL